MSGNTSSLFNTASAAGGTPPSSCDQRGADCQRKSTDFSSTAMHDQIILSSKRQGILDFEPVGADFPTLNAQQEKPSHYSYLKEFRVDPCPLFKQHQCTNHRPFSCFHWHFANQRRRKPIRRKDGTFNYSADFYCTKYDENTGICPDGDDCPYLHRVYGDVERKYHLRYYKTALCVHPTDAKGHCSKNGAHCAFAHGPEDIRNPIFDIRELQHCGELNGESIDNRDRLNFVVEDPVWQDQAYVLVNYKTEPCKKPPRLCRQGYACPYYHNGKDKRRPPQKGQDAFGNQSDGNLISEDGTDMSVRYRSTPCPNVKRGDEWGDPEVCEAGDNCPYCHTRTEQQFHPEIYKSTKCNDMLQHGYCPRGPFCAFAHTEGEMQGERRHSLSMKRPSFSSPRKDNASGTITSAQVALSKQAKSVDENGQLPNKEARRRMSAIEDFAIPTLEAPIRKNSLDQLCFTPISGNSGTNGTKADNDKNFQLPSYSAVLKHRHNSGSAAITAHRSSSGSSFTESPSPPVPYNYPKAPGFEREQHSPPRAWLNIANEVSPGSSGSCDLFDFLQTEASRIKSNLYFHHDIGCELGGTPVEQHQGPNGHVPTTPPTPGSMRSSSFSPFSGGIWQHHQYSSDDDHGNIILDECKLPAISEKEERSLDGGVQNFYASPGSVPTSLLTTMVNHVGSDNGAATMSYLQSNNLLVSAVRRNTFSFGGDLGQSAFRDGNCHDGSRGQKVEGPLSNYCHSDEELASIRCKLVAYEDCAKRAWQECESWKKEALKHQQRAQVAEQERFKAEQDRDRATKQFLMVTNELKALQLSGLLPLNTEVLPPSQLKQVRSRLRSELDKIERQMQQPGLGSVCARCGRQMNGNALSSICPVCVASCKPNGHHVQILTS